MSHIDKHGQGWRVPWWWGLIPLALVLLVVGYKYVLMFLIFFVFFILPMIVLSVRAATRRDWTWLLLLGLVIFFFVMLFAMPDY